MGRQKNPIVFLGGYFRKTEKNEVSQKNTVFRTFLAFLRSGHFFSKTGRFAPRVDRLRLGSHMSPAIPHKTSQPQAVASPNTGGENRRNFSNRATICANRPVLGYESLLLEFFESGFCVMRHSVCCARQSARKNVPAREIRIERLLIFTFFGSC